MPSSNWMRWCSLATVGAGLALPAAWIILLASHGLASPLGQTGLWFLFLSHPLNLFAIMGLYTLHQRAGGIGLAGFVLASVGNLIVAGLVMGLNTPLALPIGVLAPLGNAGLVLGFLLLGWSAWTANRLPRWSVAAWSLGMLVTVAGAFLTQEAQGNVSWVGVVGSIVFGAGFVGSGLALWSGA